MKSDKPWFSAQDLHLFNEGNFVRAYEKLGSHIVDGGVHFAVWAPAANRVSVVGDFNKWMPGENPLTKDPGSGIWSGIIEGLGAGENYKYHIESDHYQAEKADPYAYTGEIGPKTASIVAELDYEWNDAAYMKGRKSKQRQCDPVSIYEVHLGSWMRVPEEGHRFLTYREIAPKLVEYVTQLGFTHVEFMPLTEHPFTGSWGYQTTGYFAASSRYGSPQDLMFLIDALHQADIGVILDWVPSHFAVDGHALAYFDGSHLYEHSDPLQSYHPEWGSYVFNYGRHEVRSFLLSSALFWLDKYHIDGLRVDAVASMLYLDYARKPGQWVPNKYGGRENIDAVHFLRRFNEVVYEHYPDVQTYAEESTSWQMVSRPTYLGGLGFGYKWDMGWMHDTLRYVMVDPLYRKYNHNDLTFRMLYALNENFALPLSHDEVVHGKGPLWDKIAGTVPMKFAGMRQLFAYQWGQTGKKLLFMGGEFAQRREWKHDESLDWHLLQYPEHSGVMKCVADLNKLYRDESAMHELDNQPGGFEWIDCGDVNGSVVSFLRKGKPVPDHRPKKTHGIPEVLDEITYHDGDTMMGVFNFTPVVREHYRIGVPYAGWWKEVFNSDAACYGGTNVGNGGGVQAEYVPCHNRPYSVVLTLPPLAGLYLKGSP